MSRRTRSVAVAVNAATTGRAGSCSMKSPMARYDGRKSWPHCDTQCASSTATSGMAALRANSRKRGSASRSGATYMIWYAPASARRSTVACWPGVSVELR